MSKGGMIEWMERAYPVPDRFQFEPKEKNPMIMILTDTETGKQTEVGTYSYTNVRKVLNELFGEDNGR